MANPDGASVDEAGEELSEAERERWTLIAEAPTEVVSDFAEDFAAGLQASPRWISCRWLYDAEGSRLFEQICELEEYYPTRAEAEIFERHAPEIVADLAPELSLVELGSGSAVKTRTLIRATLASGRALEYVPIDISRSALVQSCRELLREEPELRVVGIAGEYARGMRWMAEHPERDKLVLWLGSNIGNLGREAAASFLRELRGHLGDRDHVLLGIDLRKKASVLEAAYDDAQGVTAAFNLNVLARANRELGADFDLDAFEHCAEYEPDEGRVRMHLLSRRAQTVRIPPLDLQLHFAEGERIHTENSYKYSPEEIDALAAATGFELKQRWMDGAGRFSANLLRTR